MRVYYSSTTSDVAERCNDAPASSCSSGAEADAATHTGQATEGALTLSHQHLMYLLPADMLPGAPLGALDALLPLGARTVQARHVRAGDRVAVIEPRHHAQLQRQRGFQQDGHSPDVPASVRMVVAKVTGIEHLGAEGFYTPLLDGSGFLVVDGVVAPVFVANRFPRSLFTPFGLDATRDAFGHSGQQGHPAKVQGEVTPGLRASTALLEDESEFTPLGQFWALLTSPIWTRHHADVQPVGTPGLHAAWHSNATFWAGVLRMHGTILRMQAHGRTAMRWLALREWFLERRVAWMAGEQGPISEEEVLAAVEAAMTLPPAGMGAGGLAGHASYPHGLDTAHAVVDGAPHASAALPTRGTLDL